MPDGIKLSFWPHSHLTDSKLGMTDYKIAASIFFVVFAFIFPFARMGVDPHHDGLLFKTAYDVFHGAIPFKETFTQYGLLLTLIHVSAMKLFGDQLIVLRLLTVLFYAGSAVLLWAIWRRFLPTSYVLLALTLWLLLAPFYKWVLLPWSSIYALFFQLAAILLALRQLEKPSSINAVLCGFFIAAAFWCRMPVGLLLFFAIIGSFAITHLLIGRFTRAKLSVFIHDAGWVVLGIAANILPLLFYLWLNDAINDWFLQTFVMAFNFAKNIPYYWHNDQGFLGPFLRAMLPFWLSPVWAILPLSALAAVIISTIRAIRAGWRFDLAGSELFLLGGVCLASWPQYYPVIEDRHVFWGASPMMGVLILLLVLGLRKLVGFVPRVGRIKRLPEYLFPTALILVLLTLFVMPVRDRLSVGYERWQDHSEYMTSPHVLAGLYEKPEEAQTYQEIADDIISAKAKHPDANLITTGYDALYLTFGPYRKNWHPLFVYFDIGLAIYPDFALRLGEYIAQEKPIILSTGGEFAKPRYRSVAHYGNGISLLVPAEAPPKYVAAQGTLDPVHDITISNLYNRYSPMRITGHRLPALPVGDNFSIQLFVKPNLIVQDGATIFTNLHGAIPLSGFEIRYDREDEKWQVIVGENGKSRSLLEFPLSANQLNNLVITYDHGKWQAWVNAGLQAQARFEIVHFPMPNQVILSNSMSRTQHFPGRVIRYRAYNVALPPQKIRQFYLDGINRYSQMTIDMTSQTRQTSGQEYTKHLGRVKQIGQ